MTRILFCGDPHGSFIPIHQTAERERVSAIVLLGDMELDRPLDEEFAQELDHGIRVLFIPGNHDFDNEVWHDNLFSSEFCENLHGRIVDVSGVRLAGLGGCFQGTIWHPHDGSGEPKFETRKAFRRTLGPQQKWRKSLPRKRRGAIWREDIEKLAAQHADILVSHEAPSTHKYGFREMDDLASSMGVHTIVHGHHHETYRSQLAGMNVVGLNMDEAWVFQQTH